MQADLDKLRELHKQLWQKSTGGRPHYRTSWWPVRKILNSEERKFVYRCIVKHNLVCSLYGKMNQGLGIRIHEPEKMLGVATYPGVTYSIKDLKHIINIDENHIFDDTAKTDYRYREWCEKHDTHMVAFCYRFFTAIVGREQNLELMKRYNFREPHIEPMGRFIY